MTGVSLALKVGKYNIGYLPFGGQVVRHSPVNKNTKPNFSESFYITRDRAPDHPDIVNNKPLVGLNRWPEDIPEFRTATTAYYRAMEAMTTRLVPLFALALDLPTDRIADSASSFAISASRSVSANWMMPISVPSGSFVGVMSVITPTR